jgi:HEAT repeat protein
MLAPVLTGVLNRTAVQARTPDTVNAARAQAVLKDGAGDNDPETRRQVAVALSLIGSRDPTAELLVQLTRDKDYLVREAAIVSVGELRNPKLAEPVRKALDDDVPEVVFAAARTLFRLKQPEGREVLVAIVEKETPAKSSFIRSKLRGILRRFKTPKSAILFTVQQGAGFIPVPGVGEGLSAMNAMLSEADFSPRATALLSLSSERSTDLRTMIEQAFLDEDWSMRAVAVQITALRQELRWRFRLVPLLEDTNRRVRYRAAACFLRLNYRSAKAGANPPARKRSR